MRLRPIKIFFSEDRGAQGRIVSILIFISGLLFAPGCTGFIEPEVLDKAAKDLRKWCLLIDYGNYMESWNRAAPELQKRVSKISWQEYLISYRQPFGEVVSRKIVEARHTTILKGIGEGAMITLKLKSEYANKTLYEKVIMVLHNGQWQVAAYMFGDINMPRS